MIKIVLDCLGGDGGTAATAGGALLALDRDPDLSLVLVGDEPEIKSVLSARPGIARRTETVHAPDVITGDDKPTDAIRLKKDSSLIKSISLLRSDDSLAGLVSTGATGAIVACATLRLGRVRGIRRPAFCPILPNMKGGIVGICDSGANMEVTPEMLLQYAVMGSMYLETVFGIDSPRAALLNVGTEEEKGDDLHREAFALLRSCPYVNFTGNMEGRELLSGRYDLAVCDGFSGNVMIKTVEGTALQLMKKIKKDIYSRGIYKFGALFMKRMFAEEKEFMNYQNYGGSVMLGIEKTVVKGHGSGDASAVARCIEQAYTMEKNPYAPKLAEGIEKIEAGAVTG